MESVPPSIYFKICHRTAHENFKYLAKHFRDNDPIPRTNELQRAGTAAAAETSEKSPTSDSAATERHVSAERNKEDLVSNTTKALTQGTEDVNNRNVGCIQDPRMSYEASAKGMTSAKCSETTIVTLESAPHETQEPHSSLPLTPRPPIEGEPSRCKQEAVDSVVTAGRMNGTVQLAEPMENADVNLEKAALGGEPVERASRVDKGGETDADVNGMALLGREPAERARGIGEGDEMERKAQSWLQELKLLCREINQCSGIANGDVPITNGLPLEGEWTAYPSGETTNSKGVELEGREGGMDKLTELLTMSVEPYVKDSSDIPHVYLGGTKMQMGDANSPGNQADRSEGQSDVSKGHREGARMYLGVGDTKCIIKEMDGVESHADVSTGHGDISSIKTNANKPAKALDNVSIPQKKIKLPDIPDSAARRCSDESNTCRNQTDTSSPCTGTQSIGDEMETAEKEMQNVRNRRNNSKTQNSPYMTKVATFKHTYRRRMVSVNDSDVYLPSNAPIEVPGRTFTFRELESGDEAIAPSLKGERVVEGDGDQSRGDSDDSDGDNTESGGSVDSQRVEGARLSTESQYTRQSQRMQDGDSPVLSRPPIRPAECPYGDIMRLRRHGRIKITSIKVSQAQKVETTYLGCTNATQPPGRDSNCIHRVHRPKRQRGRVKPIPSKVSQMHKVETTYRIRENVMQPPPNDLKRLNGAIGPRRRRDCIKIESIKVNNMQRGETTYCGRAHITQPPGNNSKRLHRVIGLERQCGHIKSRPRNINRTEEVEMTYLGCVNAIWSTWRPKRQIRRLNKLTFESRMPGELWRDDEDHG